MKSGVYRIVNKINNNAYIGSAINLRKRTTFHLWELKKNRHSNAHLQNAFNKYGLHNFMFEVISHCPPEICVKKEQYFIDYYKSNGFQLYNICKTAGSVLGRVHKENTKVKIGLANSLKRRTEEEKLNLSIKHTGKKITESHRRNISLCQIGKKMSAEAKMKIGIGNTGKVRSDEVKNRIRQTLINKKEFGKSVDKYDREGNYICTYDKIVNAAKDINCAYQNLRANLKGKRPHVRGFVFKYSKK